MTNAIKFHDLPSLRRPVLIMGFSGWPNAGEISTGTIGYLLERLEAAPLATIDPDEFIDYTADRPTAQVIEGFIDDFQESGCRFTYARSNDD
ncbi:MAG: PAC2 family protein, partial [Proteobacteria bacterium]|nr:PAC2 family protein [Pseudomonadota bacterium]